MSESISTAGPAMGDLCARCKKPFSAHKSTPNDGTGFLGACPLPPPSRGWSYPTFRPETKIVETGYVGAPAPKGAAPFGRCSGCFATFTEAGGLPGNLCVRCAAKSEWTAADEKDLSDLVIGTQPTPAEKGFPSAEWAKARADLEALRVVAVECGEPLRVPASNRRLESCDIIEASDLTANASGELDTVPSPWVGTAVGPTHEVFRPVRNGEFSPQTEPRNVSCSQPMAADAPWLSNWERLMQWLFPGAHVSLPEAPSDWADVIHFSSVATFSIADRLRILLTGRVQVEANLVCKNRVGEMITVADIRPARFGYGDEMILRSGGKGAR